MTKLPHVDWNVKGVEGPKYKVGPLCAVSECGQFADHGHHMWRRSFLTGDYQWVKLWDGRVIQNICALCFMHHDLVTIGKAEIRYDEIGEQFTYYEMNEHDNALVTDVVLVPQPKSLAEFATAMQITIDGNEVPHDDVVRVDEDPECPTCGHKRKARAKVAAGAKRNRATWPVSVPKDEQENGADVLDTLEMECAIKLGREDHSSHKYFVLAEVMAHFLMSTTTIADFSGERIHEDDGA